MWIKDDCTVIFVFLSLIKSTKMAARPVLPDGVLLGG